MVCRYIKETLQSGTSINVVPRQSDNAFDRRLGGDEKLSRPTGIRTQEMRGEMIRMKDMLIRHEGVRLKPYVDTVGKTTIGIGRNLDDVGISYVEALILFDHDVDIAKRELLGAFEWITSLPKIRMEVIIMMSFNMGIPRLKGFKNMFEALKKKDYAEAAEQMLDSKWASQVGLRSEELALVMLTGKYPT